MAAHEFLRKLNRRMVRAARITAPAARPVWSSAWESLENRLLFSTFTVAHLSDSGPGSLREAIDAANAAPGADDVLFAGGLRGTVTLASSLSVTDDLTITGRGEDTIILSGGGATRVLSVSGAATHLALNQLTIVAGLASLPGGTALGGGILSDGASVALDHVALAANRAVGFNGGGGAIAVLGGALAASHVEFDGNNVQGDPTRDCWGGALYIDRAAHVVVEHAAFTGNSATGGGTNGGAVFIADGSTVNIVHATFDGNFAEGPPTQYGAGGAVFAQSVGLSGSAAPTIDISHASFTGNFAGVRLTAPGSDVRGQAFGGAVMIEDGPTMSIAYCAFDGNSSAARSGGTGAAGVNGRLGGNAWAGAVFNVCATLNLRTSRFTNNLVRGGDGGAGGSGANGAAGGFAIGGAFAAGTLSPFIAPPVTTIEQCEFINNRAIGGNGGAGGSGGNGGAAGRADGGGVATLYGLFAMDDATIFENVALGGDGGAAGPGGARGGDGGLTRGGGFAHERGSVATVRNVSIASNQALGGAGGAARPGGDALGGGIFNGRPAELPPHPAFAANLTLIDCAVLDNLAAGGTGGAGANGGNAFGGGIVNANPIPVAGTPILTLLRCLATGNHAIGGDAGPGGTSGAGIGGGLYNQTGAVAGVDAFSSIFGNDASTSNGDIFGTVMPI